MIICYLVAQYLLAVDGLWCGEFNSIIIINPFFSVHMGMLRPGVELSAIWGNPKEGFYIF